MKEYKLAKGWQVFMWITLPLIMASGLYLLFEPLISGSEHFDLNKYLILATMGLFIVIFCIFCFRDLIVSKIIVTKNAITVRSSFGTRHLEFHEIKGISVVNNFLVLKPHNKDKKKISISSYIGDFSELQNFLRDRLIDLDEKDLEEDQKMILQDDTFGISEEDRSEHLKQVAFKARIINIAGVVSGAWVFIYPRPYDVAIISSACVLLAAIALVRTSGGLLHFGSKKNSAYPSVTVAVFSSSLSMAIRTLIDFEVYDYSPLWLSLSIATVITLVLLFPSHRERKYNPAAIVETIIASLAFGFGSVLFYNCYYDNSIPVENHVAVISKRISSGKTTTHYLSVTSWGNRADGDELTVSKNQYNKTSEGDSVTVYLSKGKLGIPWISVWTE